MIANLLTGMILGAAIGYLAWKLGALTADGAWAAGLAGGLIFGLGGLSWAVLLLTFFLSSSLFSRAFAARKESLEKNYAKSSRRDWGQVLANGGVGALMALLHGFFPAADWPWIAFVGAMAAVNADTWATELGVFNPTQPRMITSGKIVEKGTSGGVSLLGYLAAAGGALLVGAMAAWNTPGSGGLLLAAATFGGLAGSTCDSWLGATVQAIYRCPACQKETERHPLHACGSETVQVRGWRWMSNDSVNLACSIAGAGAALVVWALLLP